jgi:hypothetical protein
MPTVAARRSVSSGARPSLAVPPRCEWHPRPRHRVPHPDASGRAAGQLSVNSWWHSPCPRLGRTIESSASAPDHAGVSG